MNIAERRHLEDPQDVIKKFFQGSFFLHTSHKMECAS